MRECKREPRKCAECRQPIGEVYRSPYFCAPCDKARIERISKSLNQLADRYGINRE